MKMKNNTLKMKKNGPKNVLIIYLSNFFKWEKLNEISHQKYNKKSHNAQGQYDFLDVNLIIGIHYNFVIIYLGYLDSSKLNIPEDKVWFSL